MKRKLALLLALLMMATLLLAACGGDKTETGKEETKTETSDKKEETKEEAKEEATTDNSDRVLHMSIKANLQSIDGNGVRNLQDMLFRAQIHDALFYLNEHTLELEPRVANSYEVNDTATEFTFELNPNVKFHNGDPCTAQDVRFSLLRAKEMPGYSSFAGDIKEVEIIDDTHVKVILEGPNMAFMTNVTMLYIQSEKVVTEAGENYGSEVALGGCGPYMLTYLDNDVEWHIEAFPDYYRGEAAIKKVIYKPYVDFSAGLVAFEAGELDWYTAPIANWPDLVANEDYETEILAANHVTYLAVNYAANETLGNDYVRKAIAYSLDKESMNIAGFDGYAEIANYMVNPRMNVGAGEFEVTYNYDPEKAKELLAESGLSDVNAGNLLCFPGSHFEKCAQVANANMTAVGITNQLELVEEYTALTRARAQEFEMDMTGGSDIGDFDGFRTKVHSEGVGSYFVKFEGDKFDWKKFDQLFADGRAAVDPAERQAIYGELHDAVMDTACLIPVLHKAQPYVWTKDLNTISNPTNPIIYDWSWK